VAIGLYLFFSPVRSVHDLMLVCCRTLDPLSV